MLAVGSETTTEDAGARQNASPPRGRGVRGALLVLGLVVLLVGAGFLWFVRALPVQEVMPPRGADGIVALTGAAFRINDAVDLLAAGHGRRLLISGVNPMTRSGEIARSMPEHQRWFSCCIDLDHSALNTIGNAIETRRWVKDQGFVSLIVVTSNFHMPRAMAELGHQLPGVVLVPFPVISDRVRVESWWSSPSTARLLFSEYLKYIVAVVRTRLDFASA
jgi:uncharacterized SAM-binding protein YcdF (DUF218 family)